MRAFRLHTHVDGPPSGGSFFSVCWGFYGRWTTCRVTAGKLGMAQCADRKRHRRQPSISEDLIGAQHVSWMMCLELKARRGEDNGELSAFRESERRKREAAGHLLPVDIRHRTVNARRWRLPHSPSQARRHRTPAIRRQVARRCRSRSGRGSPPGDPDGDSEPLAVPPHREGRPDA